VFGFGLISALLLGAGCSQSPEDVRAWMRDKRAPVKMREFIQSERNPLESKVEAVMVLLERNNSTDIPPALGEPLKVDELNRIVAGAIVRMQALLDKDRPNYETRVKDAAYAMAQLEVNEENRAALLDFIHQWLDSDNFFLPISKSGRVEQRRLFEVLGAESLTIYQKAIRRKLDQLVAAVKEETAAEEEARAAGKKIRVLVRPSDQISETLSSTLASLEALKLPGSGDMVAGLFIEFIEATYPDMPRGLVLPFSGNASAKLIPIARRILTDPNYQNETLNYFKNVMLATYYRNVQKKEGVAVCTELLQTDRTGYVRWDCLEILTIDAGRAGLAALLRTIPDNYEVLAIPADHPTLLARPAMSFWNSLLVYCSHLPHFLNGTPPLDVFHEMAKEGPMVGRILSMACLTTLGGQSDVEFLLSLGREKTAMNNWGMQITTTGELATYTANTLNNRLKYEAMLAEKAAAEKAAETAAAEGETEAAKADREEGAEEAAQAAE